MKPIDEGVPFKKFPALFINKPVHLAVGRHLS
jgi:hypothetical protein